MWHGPADGSRLCAQNARPAARSDRRSVRRKANPKTSNRSARFPEPAYPLVTFERPRQGAISASRRVAAETSSQRVRQQGSRGDESGSIGQCVGDQAVVDPPAAGLAGGDAGVDQHLQMVADGRLGQPDRFGPITHARLLALVGGYSHAHLPRNSPPPRPRASRRLRGCGEASCLRQELVLSDPTRLTGRAGVGESSPIRRHSNDRAGECGPNQSRQAPLV